MAEWRPKWRRTANVGERSVRTARANGRRSAALGGRKKTPGVAGRFLLSFEDVHAPGLQSPVDVLQVAPSFTHWSSFVQEGWHAVAPVPSELIAPQV